MRTSLIWRRVADFLKQHLPFEYLSESDLLEVVSSGRVGFHQSEEEICRAGAARREWIWVIQQGTVEVLDPEGTVIDILGPGEIVGMHTFVTPEPYTTTCRTASDVILYVLDARRLVPLVRQYPEAVRFLNAYFATRGGYAIAAEESRSWFEQPPPPADILKRRALPPHANAASAEPDLPVGEYLLRAIREGADHVVLTSDGQADGAAGVLTPDDLAVCAGCDVLALFRTIRRAADTAELAYLYSRGRALVSSAIARPTDVAWCSALSTELNLAVVRRAKDLAAVQLGPAPLPYAVLGMGELGRGELLARRVEDLVILYADSGTSDTSAGAEAYFHKLGEAVAETLGGCDWVTGSQSGDLAVRSLSQWRQVFDRLISDPVLQGAFEHRGLFDAVRVCGDAELAQALLAHVREALAQDRVFLAVLSNDTTTSLPPLTLYGDTVVDLDGARREGLDLRVSVIDPLVDVARFLALSQGNVDVARTVDRLQQATERFPDKNDVFRQAIEAFHIAVWFEFRSLRAMMTPASLTGYDRSLLKSAFRSVHTLLDLVCATEEANYA